MAANPLAREFVDRSAGHLRECMDRIERALQTLPTRDLWWRPHESQTSVGNLLLHLEGNVRQWVLAGLAGQPDRRRRSTEFERPQAAQEPGAEELAQALRQTVEEACRVLESLDVTALLSERKIQVYEGVSGLEAVLHVVEHFSWHTGQITWIAKTRAGADHRLSYYEDDALEVD